jgi:hypothetical protein
MMRQRQVFASLLFGGAVVFVLGLGALAQSVSLTVTAYSDAVRFSAQGAVKELRVEVLSLSGQRVFDSGPVLGNTLDWKLLNTQGQPVANGVYLYTVTVKDPSGNVTKRLGKLAVLRGKGVASPPLTVPTVGQLAGIQPLAIPPGVAWRQRLGQDGQDNYRVQRRPGSRQPYQTLLLLEADGKLRVSELCLGATNGVGGDCRSVWPGGGAVGWALTGNAGTDPATNFLGTTDNTALEIRVNNARALRFEPNATSPNIIGGFSGNSVTSGVVGATISGGGQSGGINQVTANFGTVGGGEGNTASGSWATVGGGGGNTASGDPATVGGGGGNTASGNYATVGGGGGNTASGFAATVGGGGGNTASGNYATVGGGGGNTASGPAATVGGGYLNTASGFYATVGGGVQNTAAGDYSFVVGRRAKNTNAAHEGVFLFADSNDFDFPSTAANQFRVRSTGGAQFVLGIDASGNPTWTCSVSNGTSWACSSDRNLKENLTLVDGRNVLAQLSALPIYTWSAKGGDPAVRHMGPMAQDFYSTFGLGTDDKTISTIDLDGVALVSIQALYQMSLEKDKKIEQLTKELEELRQKAAQLEELQRRIEQLEKLVQELSAKK